MAETGEKGPWRKKDVKHAFRNRTKYVRYAPNAFSNPFLKEIAQRYSPICVSNPFLKEIAQEKPPISPLFTTFAPFLRKTLLWDEIKRSFYSCFIKGYPLINHHFRPFSSHFVNSDPILNPLWWVDRWVDRWLPARWLKGTVYPYSLWATSAKDSKDHQTIAKPDHFSLHFRPISSILILFWTLFGESIGGSIGGGADGSLVKRDGVHSQSLSNPPAKDSQNLSKPCETDHFFAPFRPIFVNSDPILNPLWWIDRWVDRWGWWFAG